MEISDTRDNYRDQTVKEFIHNFITQSDLASNWHSFPEFKIGNGFFGTSHYRFSSRYLFHIFYGIIQNCFILSSSSHSHTYHNLIQLWHLMYIFIVKLLLQIWDNRIFIMFFQSIHSNISYNSSPDFLHIRTLRPSRTLYTGLETAFNLSLKSITLEASIGASIEMIPP